MEALYDTAPIIYKYFFLQEPFVKDTGPSAMVSTVAETAAAVKASTLSQKESPAPQAEDDVVNLSSDDDEATVKRPASKSLSKRPHSSSIVKKAAQTKKKKVAVISDDDEDADSSTTNSAMTLTAEGSSLVAPYASGSNAGRNSLKFSPVSPSPDEISTTLDTNKIKLTSKSLPGNPCTATSSAPAATTKSKLDPTVI